MSTLAAARHVAFRARRRFAALDGLRCLAIVPVVWHHATPRPLEGVLGRGPLGVDLFFVISGFLITTLLLRERERAARIDLRAFYLRRALRIMPLYYAVLALHVLRALARPVADPIRAHFFASLPFYVTYTANWLVRFDVPHPISFGFAWSLATEEQFYAVWPFVLVLAGRVAERLRAGRAAASLGVPALVALGLVALDLRVEGGGLATVFAEGSLARRMVQSIATPIGLGALAAIAMHDARSFAALDRLLGGRLGAPIAVAVLALCVAVPAPVLPTHLAMTLVVVATTIREDGPVVGLLRLPPAARLGAVSYGVYLFHVAAIVAARAIAGDAAPTPLVFGLGLACAWAAAELSFRYVEAPLLRLRPRREG